MLIETSDPREIRRRIEEAVPNDDGRGGDDRLVLLLVAEQDPPDLEELVRELRATGLTFCGGLFPGVVWGGRRHDRGVVVATLPKLDDPVLLDPLEAADRTLESLRIDPLAAGGQPTALVLVDGLAPRIGGFLRDLHNRFGNSLHYLGGGAGSLSLEPRPCVFTADGVARNAAVVAPVALSSRLGVRHGWRHLAGPVVATATEGNVIRSLNWRRALDVYAETVEADGGERPAAGSFFDLSKRYPFGIYKQGQEEIIRDPIATNERGEIVCVGEVPENAVLDIMKGEPDELIAAAGRAAEECLEGMRGTPHCCLVVDCVSRVIFLEDRFEEELAAVADRIHSLGTGPPLLGILSLGEISSTGEGFLEFFNKTIVIGMLSE